MMANSIHYCDISKNTSRSYRMNTREVVSMVFLIIYIAHTQFIAPAINTCFFILFLIYDRVLYLLPTKAFWNTIKVTHLFVVGLKITSWRILREHAINILRDGCCMPFDNHNVTRIERNAHFCVLLQIEGNLEKYKRQH